jgi:uncharacterized protein
MFSLERFRNLIGKLLHLNDTPKRIALAFAIGVFIGFSPPTGLHAALALVLAWIIGLNKVIMVLGTFVNNPWTLVPIYGSCLWIGLHLYGEHRIPPMDWSSVMPGNLIHHFEDAGAQGESLLAALTSTAVYFIGQFRSYFVPFLIGTIVLGLVASIAAYFVVHSAIVEYRKIREHSRGRNPVE